MFEVTNHDFGTVAQGAKTQYSFKFKNLYEEDIHISGVRSSCGCTTPECPKPTLKTFEQGEIVCTFNTDKFTGSKHATITVSIDRPYVGEVQLNVGGTIRTDVSFSPNFVDLGSVDRGAATEKKVQVNYRGGRSDWKIMDVLSTNNAFEVEVNPLGRTGGQVSYNLVVRLKNDAPIGFIKEQLLLVTNEGRTVQIPLDVEGRVVPEVTVSPAALFLGVVEPGKAATKQIVVKAKRPFLVTDVQCDDTCFSCKLPQEKKTLQLIPVTFTADDTTAGKITKKLKIQTDISTEPQEITVSVQISDNGKISANGTR